MYTSRINADTQNEEAKYKLLVYKNKIWNYLYTEKEWYKSDDYIENNMKVKYNETTYEIDKNAVLMKRVFVHKEEWIEGSFWNISDNLRWGSGNGSTGKRWSGTSYFDVKMPKKILHFKQGVVIEYPDEYLRAPFAYHIYKPAKGDYLLFNDIENSRYYLIRPKSK